ncbi:MAG: DUF6478 family protein [Mangrovicoccus sp.]
MTDRPPSPDDPKPASRWAGIWRAGPGRLFLRLRLWAKLQIYRGSEPVLHFTPEPWRKNFKSAPLRAAGRITADIALFHDAQDAADIEVTPIETGLHVQIGKFDGNYLSLAVDLPEDFLVSPNSGAGAILWVGLTFIGSGRMPGHGFLRLNLSQGLIPLQTRQPLPMRRDHVRVAMDLGAALTKAGRRRDMPLRGWVDLVFTDAARTDFSVTELSFERRPPPVL